MVATLLRLKLTLLRHGLARDVWRLVLLVLGGVWALGMTPSVLGGAIWLRGQSAEVAGDVLVVAGTLLVVGWAVVPVLVFGADETLDPTKFAFFGTPVRRLVPGLLAAATLSVPAVFCAIVCAATVLAWSASGTPTLVVALLAAPVGLATCLLAARLTTTASARLLGSRRGREASAVAGALVVAVAVPAVLVLSRLGLEGALERVPTVTRVIGWTPVGLVWAAPAALARGEPVGAVLRLLLAVVWLVVGVLVWAVLLRRLLTRPAERSGGGRRAVDGMLAGSRLRARTPDARATAAIAARARRYWVADPRYLTALVGVVLLPLVMALLLGVVLPGQAAAAVAIGPLLAATIGWGRHNDVAFDGSAFWMHVASGAAAVPDRRGRVRAVLGWAVPLVAVASVAGPVLARRWELLPATVGLSAGLLAAGLAVSAVTSAVLPYPVPAPGSSPFATEAGGIGESIAAQLVASIGTLVLALPVLAGFALALGAVPAAGWVTLVLGVVGGAVLLEVATRYGGAVLHARAPRLLARLPA